jgi:hypothetical protein
MTCKKNSQSSETFIGSNSQNVSVQVHFQPQSNGRRQFYDSGLEKILTIKLILKKLKKNVSLDKQHEKKIQELKFITFNRFLKKILRTKKLHLHRHLELVHSKGIFSVSKRA